MLSSFNSWEAVQHPSPNLTGFIYCPELAFWRGSGWIWAELPSVL